MYKTNQGTEINLDSIEAGMILYNDILQGCDDLDEAIQAHTFREYYSFPVWIFRGLTGKGWSATV